MAAVASRSSHRGRPGRPRRVRPRARRCAGRRAPRRCRSAVDRGRVDVALRTSSVSRARTRTSISSRWDHRDHRRLRGAAVQPCSGASSTGSARLQPPSSVGRAWQHAAAAGGLLAKVLLGSTLLVALQTLVQAPGAGGQLPDAAALELPPPDARQSMGFYQDEFAGRIATKVMQTALAVRDTWMIVADILVFVLIYFVTMVAVVGGFDAGCCCPSWAGWCCTSLTLRYFVPRLASVAQGAGRCPLADDRAHHRRLHQHRHREAVLARAARGRPTRAAAMQEFLGRCTARCGWSPASRSSTTCSACC
jgi:hypothetical protein